MLDGKRSCFDTTVARCMLGEKSWGWKLFPGNLRSRRRVADAGRTNHVKRVRAVTFLPVLAHYVWNNWGSQIAQGVAAALDLVDFS